MPPYIKGNQLGRGSFGQVFAGVRSKDGISVALKEIPKSHVRRYAFIDGRQVPVEMFLMKKVRNIPGVVQFYEWFDTRDLFVIVMERRASFISLREYVHLCNNCLTERTAQKIISQVSFTLYSMVAVGVFHGDVKSENILIDPDTMETRIIDFGCADVIRVGVYDKFLGTQSIQPPEMLRHCRYQAEPATVWFVGLLLFFLLTGAMPFNNSIDIFRCSFRCPRHLTLVCKDFLYKCLAADPKKRMSLLSVLNHTFLSS